MTTLKKRLQSIQMRCEAEHSCAYYQRLVLQSPFQLRLLFVRKLWQLLF